MQLIQLFLQFILALQGGEIRFFVGADGLAESCPVGDTEMLYRDHITHCISMALVTCAAKPLTQSHRMLPHPSVFRLTHRLRHS